MPPILPVATSTASLHPRSDTFARSRWLFLRLLGVIYLIAFLSLAVQATGLVGERGILPAGEFLQHSRELYGARAYRFWPTLAWLSSSDLFLSGLCWTGAALSVALLTGLAPTASASLLWLLYLSLVNVGQEFLEFQWDALLLETGLLAVLYAPLVWRSRLGADPEPPVLVRWVIWFLAFKLTFLSGITKLASGDVEWANWTALDYHYETQPIPAWTSWFMHQLPPWVHSWTTLGMFVVELGVPWLIAAPRRLAAVRVAACLLMILLQVGIAATGNYGFFNLLTIVLYVTLLDDRTIGRFLPDRAKREAGPARRPGPAIWRFGVGVAALGIGCLSLMTLVREIDRTRGRAGLIDGSRIAEVFAWISPLRSINGYGLFRVMTTERPEIVIEVSPDGEVWREYPFRWKAGDVRRRPVFVQPHMPRLDWQMWFAALDPPGARQWLLRLAERLLDGEATVLGLLGPHPLEGRARYVRFSYYRYRFTSAAERAATGAWWARELIGYLTDPIGPDRR